jgi:pimeloyl-ACP methyl ester carboxylesterase
MLSGMSASDVKGQTEEAMTQTQERRDAHAGSTYYKTLNRSGYAPVNGLRMYYEIHGTVVARPLISVHPFLGLANVLPTLARNRQLIAVELQGHGRTRDIDRPLSFEQDAEDLVALLDYLKIDVADLFGESFGGVPVVQMAIRHPKRVRRVATFGSPFGPMTESYRPESLRDLMSLTHDHRSVQYQRECYERVAPEPAGFADLFAKVRKRQWNGFSRDDLKALRVPLLIATSDHDALGARLDHQLDIARLVPNAQFAVVPDSGHFLLNEDPDRLVPILAHFFDQPTPTVPFATTLSGYHPGETR